MQLQQEIYQLKITADVSWAILKDFKLQLYPNQKIYIKDRNTWLICHICLVKW